MQTDVNTAKSRTFNLQLRFLQLGLCLVATFLVDRAFNVTCVQQSFQIINIMGICMVVVSISALLFQTLRKYHNRIAFAIGYGLNVVFCLVILIYSMLNYNQSGGRCPTKNFLYLYYMTNIPLYLILSAMIIFMPFYWVQRFTNSPGSAVWPFLFFIQSTHTKYTVIMIIIGILTLTSNLLTWSTNGLALLNGVSTVLKKVLWVSVIVGLVFTGVNEVMALVIVFMVPKSDFAHILVKSMLEAFLFVNFIDFCFWMLGLLSLNYENGDVVRDGLLGQQEEEKEEEEEVVDDEFGVHYGTLQQE